MTDKIVVLVTCGSAREARRIGRALVEQRLVACANVIQVPVQSIYRWKGKIESARECLVVLKTSRKCFTAVQRTIRRLHQECRRPHLYRVRFTQTQAQANRFCSTFPGRYCEELGWFLLDVLAVAARAGHRFVVLRQGEDLLEGLMAVQADVIINRHGFPPARGR